MDMFEQRQNCKACFK